MASNPETRAALVALLAVLIPWGEGCTVAPESAESKASEAAEADAADAPFLGGFFPIAADYQPHHLFEHWKKRGVNTMIRVPPGDTVEDWTHKANELGLRMIREPRSDPHKDVNEQNLLAWHWKDEPELHGVPASQLASFRQHMHDIDPKMPIAVNFWGGGMLESNSGCFNGHCYKDYIDHADWISDDIYPCNKYSCKIDLVGRMVSKLRHWADKGQQVFAYIETSDFDGNGTGPSPRRFRAEVFDAIIHGARGVYYFTVRLKSGCAPGSGCLADYDATPNDVAAAMPPLHALLTKLGPVLQRGINPSSVSMKVKDPLEAGWRRASDGTLYFVVLNTSENKHQNQKLELHGVHPAGKVKVVNESRYAHVDDDNDLVDDFEPYEEHIYEVDPN